MTADDAVRELLSRCALKDIVIRQFGARLRAQDEEGLDELSESEASSELGMGFDVQPDHIDYAFTVRVISRMVEATAEVVARYELEVGDSSEEVLVHFANRVAFFAAYPYLREVVHTSTARLPGTLSFILPMIQDPPEFSRTDNSGN